jgi:hypothetical protein
MARGSCSGRNSIASSKKPAALRVSVIAWSVVFSQY